MNRSNQNQPCRACTAAKLAVSYSRKVGLPGFGSAGAGCAIEVPLHALPQVLGDISHPPGGFDVTESPLRMPAGTRSLQEQCQAAFDECRAAVERQLAEHIESLQQSPPENRPRRQTSSPAGRQLPAEVPQESFAAPNAAGSNAAAAAIP